jgi:hypothetical protein
MNELGYRVEYDAAGNVILLAIEHEKLGDESDFFSVLAEYSKPGSYIQFRGEEGDRWRWVVGDDNRLKQILPLILWEGQESKDL